MKLATSYEIAYLLLELEDKIRSSKVHDEFRKNVYPMYYYDRPSDETILKNLKTFKKRYKL